MKREFFYVKPSKRLIIGDPMYLETIANKTDTGCEKKLIFDKKRLPKDMTCKIVIEEKEEKIGDYSFKTIYIKIMCVKNTHNIENILQMFNTFENNKWYPSLISKKGELGCDTACFSIETDNSYLDFRTGADGYYGDYFIHKNTDAYCITLALDTDMFDFDEIVNDFKYLFKEEKLGERI